MGLTCGLDATRLPPRPLVGHEGEFMVTRRVFCFAVISLPSIAWADLYDDYINSSSKQAFVAFLGREGSLTTVGHAFVGIGVQIDSGLRVYERLFGLYPKDGALAAAKSILSPTTGTLDYTWKDVSWDTEFIKAIDENQKQLLATIFDKWNSSTPQYSLTANDGLNCNSLVSKVASTLGLNTPDAAGATRPWVFIQNLKSLN